MNTGEINAAIESGISGIRTSKAFANEAAEDAKSVEEIKAELKAKARTLSGYSNGQRPRDLEELQSFCKDLGCPDFPAVLLWSEMEFHGWEIQDGDAWRPVKSWKGFVIHRIAVEECEG